ncbi:hypothetical protein CEP52_007913 [Fusarium oligoseptatum]|uniref:Zn(2)-C6 fungal-type domain-containing protein n=1 Tax=Fusarium oligoseptatum TaxID=2604345 RepID=A0A428TKB1_9HYPO|nr:hypothetical protein CEP52_007913 [Fusarium oligoseptatum]
MSEPERRRRRPAVSCSLCRKRKIRCNREVPCSNCVRSRNDACIYENHPLQVRSRGFELGHPVSHTTPTISTEIHDAFMPTCQDQASNTSSTSTALSHSATSLEPPQASTSTLSTPPSSQDVEALRFKIRQLEDQVLKAHQGSSQSVVSTPTSNIETTSSRIGGTFHFHSENRIFGRALPITRGISHKTRLFGQSHFVYTMTLLKDMHEMLEKHAQETSPIVTYLTKCKGLARLIKARRAPPWPTSLTTQLPPKGVTDELVECYLRTTEKIYRILHVPTFRKQYEALYSSQDDPERPFLVQLKLVLALGAVTHDEKFSLRVSAVRWIYEAQSWVSEPEFKSRLGVQYLQTNILLLLAREMVQVSGESPWVAAGSLYRTAVSMGLHRDPVHLSKRTRFVSEIRRRLWNTILEISLQASLSSGSPPLISLDDFDTEPPGNFDDDQLLAEDPAPRPEHEFTELSIARALRKTFPDRLNVAKLLNNIGSQGSYEETLRLDAELRASYRALTQTLHSCKSAPGRSPSQFELCSVDFIMRRYVSALHFPFLGPSLYETCYAFSRKVSVENSFKLWCAACPPSSESSLAAHSGNDAFASSRYEFSRYTICGFGFFRTVAWQASLIIAIELKNQLQEEESLCPAPLRSDLLCALEDSKTWSLRCIEAGETNIKGYLGINLAAAQIQGLQQGFSGDVLAEFMIRAGEAAEERCLPILECAAAEMETDELDQSQLPSNAVFDFGEDWDFMMSNGIFYPGDGDPMAWML